MIRRHALPLALSSVLFVLCLFFPYLLTGQAGKKADLCVFRDGLFLCDTAHNGGTAELRLRFGRHGDLPFLADFYGYGRADPCIFRNRHFLCDVSRNGRPSESASFDTLPPGAQPLLGDVDGAEDDGADPCYRLGSRWVCLVWNPIVGTHKVFWDFGSSTGRGLLGDVNGDGLADRCVYRRGRFDCQAWRPLEGSYTVLSFDLREEINPAGIPLLGDMNGDGRDDPCVYDAGRLICGIFPPGASRPTRILKVSFGKTGDIPLLGDVDGL